MKHVLKPIAPAILAAALAACGGEDPAAASNPWLGAVTVTGGTPATVDVTFSATGVSPSSVSVPAGGSIRFVNADAVAHWPESNFHCTMPQHQQCPWLNMPAAIAAGASFTVGPAAATPTACGFHDHLNPPSCGGGGNGY